MTLDTVDVVEPRTYPKKYPRRKASDPNRSRVRAETRRISVTYWGRYMDLRAREEGIGKGGTRTLDPGIMSPVFD